MAAPIVVVSRAPSQRDDRPTAAASGTGGDQEELNVLGRSIRDCRAFEDALVADLCAVGHRVVVVPHLYYLRPGQAALTGTLSHDGQAVVASWLNPRAALWTLHSLGVQRTSDLSIRCVDMGAFCCAGRCAESMLNDVDAPRPGYGSIAELSETQHSRWYPVVDYSRCVSCGKCFEFCLFGAYAREGTEICVARPDACKNGCPACARVCPAGAIMFPHYVGDPVIAGAEAHESAEDTRELVLQGRLHGGIAASDDHSAPDNGASCPCEQSGERRDAEAAPDDDLRALSEALDRFDE